MTTKEIERDWSKAIALIIKGENLSEDLEKRLLEYKKEAQNK